MKRNFGILFIILALLVTMIFTVGCDSNKESKESPDNVKTSDSGSGDVSGEILIDGSSTVFPITQAVAEEIVNEYPGIKAAVSASGTGGGMKKFTSGEIQICDASRAIKDEEIALAKQNGIEYEEFSVGYDGITVVVNPANDWLNDITVEDLSKMWKKDSTVKKWSDVNPDWPDEEIKFYAPGVDSGTFEYFTEEINGEKGNLRTDVTPSEDDNVLVKGVEGDKNAIGFFGYAYYQNNKEALKDVKIAGIEPTIETIKDGTYAPLSRPLFIYVNKRIWQNLM